MIAERVLPAGHGSTYVSADSLLAKAVLPPPPYRYHVWCSPHNVGAAELMGELGQYLGSDVAVTQELSELTACSHALVYLTELTWTSGKDSERLAGAVRQAMEAGVHLVLAHEMPGLGGQTERHSIEFASLFSHVNGVTPSDLVRDGIYREIALPLKGGVLRDVSLKLLAKAIGLPPKHGSHDTDEGDGAAAKVKSPARSPLGRRFTHERFDLKNYNALSYEDSSYEPSCSGQVPDVAGLYNHEEMLTVRVDELVAGLNKDPSPTKATNR